VGKAENGLIKETISLSIASASSEFHRILGLQFYICVQAMRTVMFLNIGLDILPRPW